MYTETQANRSTPRPMPAFIIRLEALAAPNPFGGPALPALSETFTLEAADRRAAYRAAPAVMSIRPKGQELRIFIDGQWELGNH